MSKRKLPPHIHGTYRAFKARKRRELKEALKAFYKYSYGCVFDNARNGEVGRIFTAFDAIKKANSVKEWGR